MSYMTTGYFGCVDQITINITFAAALEVTLYLPMLDYMANLTHIFVVLQHLFIW